MWLLVCSPCPGERSHTHAHMDSTNWTEWVIFKRTENLKWDLLRVVWGEPKRRNGKYDYITLYTCVKFTRIKHFLSRFWFWSISGFGLGLLNLYSNFGIIFVSISRVCHYCMYCYYFKSNFSNTCSYWSLFLSLVVISNLSDISLKAKNQKPKSLSPLEMGFIYT